MPVFSLMPTVFETLSDHPASIFWNYTTPKGLPGDNSMRLLTKQFFFVSWVLLATTVTIQNTSLLEVSEVQATEEFEALEAKKKKSFKGKILGDIQAKTYQRLPKKQIMFKNENAAIAAGYSEAGTAY